MLALHLYNFLFKSSNFWTEHRLSFTFLRCVIPFLCRVNQTIKYIVKHNYRLGGTLFTVRKAQLYVSATNVGHLQVVQ